MLQKKDFLPPFILFDVVLAAAILYRQKLFAAGIDAWVIIGGNIVLFVVTLLTIYMNTKAMAHANTHGFMRNVYGGFLLKFFFNNSGGNSLYRISKRSKQTRPFGVLGALSFIYFFWHP